MSTSGPSSLTAPVTAHLTEPSAPPTAYWTLSVLVSVAILGLMAWSSWHMGAFWLDEVDSIGAATRPWPAMWRALEQSSMPLGHHLLLAGWLALFGDVPREVSLRLLGFLISVGTLAAVWRFTLRHAQRPPLFFGLLFFLAPTVVRSMGTIRPYGLSALILLLLTDELLRQLRQENPRRLWLCSLLALLAIHNHYLSVVAIVLLAAAACMAGGKSAWRPALAMLLPLLTMAIYLPILRVSAQWLAFIKTDQIRWQGPWEALIKLLAMEHTLPLYLWAAGLFMVLWGLAFNLHRLAPTVMRFHLAILLLLPAGCALFLVLQRTNFSPWYLIPALTVSVACLECLVPHQVVAARREIMAALLLVPVMVAVQLFYAVNPLSQPQSTLDRSAAFVKREVSSEDLIVVRSFYNAVGWNYYFGDHHSWRSVPPITDASMLRFDLLQQAQQGDGEPMNQLLADCKRTLRAGHRVFLIGATSLPHGQPGGKQKRRQEWEGALVELLDRHPTRSRHMVFGDFTDGAKTYYENAPVNIFSGWRP